MLLFYFVFFSFLFFSIVLFFFISRQLSINQNEFVCVCFRFVHWISVIWPVLTLSTEVCVKEKNATETLSNACYIACDKTSPITTNIYKLVHIFLNRCKSIYFPTIAQSIFHVFRVERANEFQCVGAFLWIAIRLHGK